MKINIRDASTADRSIIVQLIQELAAIEGDPSLINDDYIETYLADPNVGIILAEVDGDVIGLLSYALRPNLYHAGIACLIDELVVSEKMRNKQAGAALIEELLKRLKTMECIEIYVAVMPHNHKAKDFYRKHGFESEISLLERHIVD